MDENGNKKLEHFFTGIKGDVGKVEINEADHGKFNNIPILSTQCLYVYDFARNKITYCRNAHVLGFEDDEFSFENALDYHPNDQEVINTVTKASIKYGIEENMFSHDCCLELTFRIRKKDGAYVQVLKQTTIYDLDENERMSTNVTILSDISFINSPGHINWSFKLKNLTSEQFEDQICSEVRKLFSKKELELIPYFIKGETSQVISDKFFISKHTVDTHRRNIKSKSGCSNMYELMTFATRNKLV